MTDKVYPEPDELSDAALIKEVMEIAEANYYQSERGYRALRELAYRLLHPK